MKVDLSPVRSSVRMNGGKTVGADEVAIPASHCAQFSFWSLPLFGFLYVRIKRTSSLSVCCVDTTKHFTRCAGSSVIMGKSPRPSTSNRRISSFSPAWPLISCRTALCLPKTSRAMSQYIRSRSSRGVPRAIASAIIPPVETPPMRSNSSWMGLPAARSSARSCQISVRPFIPPPSRERSRSPLFLGECGAGIIGSTWPWMSSNVLVTALVTRSLLSTN